MAQELGVDFNKAKNITVNPLDYKAGVIKYVRKANCPVCFTDKQLSCEEAISAIENETPEGIAICRRVIEDALQTINLQRGI